MTREEVDNLCSKYQAEMTSDISWLGNSTQYDDRSALINYSFVREFKPKVVLEFGSRTGRCTHDILQALIKNGDKYDFRSYELENELRSIGQAEIDRVFGKKSIKIGGDVTKSELPDNIDYLFIDNCHGLEITKWVFDTLLKRCKPGCLVQIHDIAFKDDFFADKRTNPEGEYILELHSKGALPLTKICWTWEEGTGLESSFWRYEPK